MKRIFFMMAFLGLFIFAACSKKAAPAKTVSEPPKPKVLTYIADVQPLMQMKCSPCHLPSKGGFKTNFENYASAQKYAADMVRRIELNPTDKGFMPFKNSRLSEAEIAVFKKWVSDGALEK